VLLLLRQFLSAVTRSVTLIIAVADAPPRYVRRRPGRLSLMGKVPIKRRRRPTHPGAILREDLLPAAGINQTQLADLIGVSRRTVHEVVQERRPISVDMAQRLSRILGNSPQFWLNMQQAVDLWDTSEAK